MTAVHRSKRARADRTFRRLLLGAALAGALGAEAGAVLRPQEIELHRPAAPQQLYAPDGEILALERETGGWPARALS